MYCVVYGGDLAEFLEAAQPTTFVQAATCPAKMLAI